MTADGDWRALNRAMWDERVPIHAGGDFYDVDAFLRQPDRIRPFEVDEVGPVEGKDLVHLQCHFGLDTLSWATRGAHVIGLDFSAAAVATATDLAAKLGYDATFVAADVYDAVEALGGRQFDIVYTGFGALNWLPDIERWAAVVHALVRPGGFLYLSEFHPLTWVFGEHELTFEHSYFDDQPYFDDSPGTYTDRDAATQHNASYEWQHTLGDVVTAVAGAGLRVESLREHPYTLYQRWPFLDKRELDHWHLPVDRPPLPLMYSLRARRD